MLALFAVAFKWAFLTKGEWELLFVGAPLMVLAVFLYARLIGRLAFVLAFTKSLFRERKKKKPKSAAEGGKPAAEDKEEVARTLAQPRDLPPIRTAEGELTGYDVAFEDEAPRSASWPSSTMRMMTMRMIRRSTVELGRHHRRCRRDGATPTDSRDRSRVWSDEDEDEPTSYGVHEPEVVPVESTPQELVQPKESEMRLLSRDDVPKQAKRGLGAGAAGVPRAARNDLGAGHRVGDLHRRRRDGSDRPRLQSARLNRDPRRLTATRARSIKRVDGQWGR